MAKEKNPSRKPGKLVKQAKGGAIWQGPAPGRKAAHGGGRPSSKVRAALRLDFDERRGVLRDIADGVVPLFREKCPECGWEPPALDEKELRALMVRPSDRAKALDVMARYGLGVARHGLDENLLRALASDVQEELGPGQEVVLQRIHRRWVQTLGTHLSAGDG